MPRETMLTVGELIEQLQMCDKAATILLRIPIEGTRHVAIAGLYEVFISKDGSPYLVTWNEGCEWH